MKKGPGLIALVAVPRGRTQKGLDKLHYNFLAVQAVTALSPRQNHDYEPSRSVSLPMHATCKSHMRFNSGPTL